MEIILFQVHKEINDLKTTVLFASPPVRINQQAILSAIDHIGVESKDCFSSSLKFEHVHIFNLLL